MKRRQFITRASATLVAAATPFAALTQTRPLLGTGLRGTRNALDFGIAPDAATDQSALFQAMFDTAATEGTAIFVPGGMYVLSGVRLPSGIVIEGVPGATRLVHTGDGPLLRAAGATGITLRGLALDGVLRPVDEREGLIDLRDVAGFSIEDCALDRAGANAVYLQGSTGEVRGTTISGAGQFAVFAMDCAGVTVTGNRIDSCLNGGVIVHRSEPGHDGAIITENQIANTGASEGGTGQWGNAINLFRADDAIVANNVISGSAFSAIRGNTVRRMQVIGNVCRDNGETAIYAEFAFEDAVIANNIIDGAANGISAPNLDHGGHGATISGNIIRNLRTAGPYVPEFPGFGTGIAVEADAVVTGNLIDGAPLYGINAGWGPYLREVVVSANTVRNARIGIGVSDVEGAGRALIRGNLIDAHEAGIQPHAWGKPIGPDLLADPQAAPDHVLVSGNVST